MKTLKKRHLSQKLERYFSRVENWVEHNWRLKYQTLGNSRFSNYLTLSVVLGLIPLICVLVFFLPVDIQESLMVNVTILNPLTFVTSVFVHGGFEHLAGNGSVYFLVASLAYCINRKSGHERFFLYSFLAVLFVSPLLYYPILFLLNFWVFHFTFVSFGLSLVVASLIGLLIPSLIIFLNEGLELKINPQRFLLSIICLTGVLMLLPYLKLEFYNLTVLFALMILGSYIGRSELSRISQFIANTKKEKRAKNGAIATISILVVYAACVALLFPTTIVQASGSIVDIFAHYFGVFFGLLVPYYLIPKRAR